MELLAGVMELIVWAGDEKDLTRLLAKEEDNLRNVRCIPVVSISAYKYDSS